MVSDANVRRIPRESLERHHPRGMEMRQEAPAVEIGLNAAIVAVLENEPVVLVVRDEGAANGSQPGAQDSLPSGPFSPLEHRTLESGLRSWVSEQAGIELGYVEQLYSFGDRGRHAQPGDAMPHVVSIGYLALTDETREREGKPAKSVWSHVFRVRTMVYTALRSIVGIALIVALFLRSEIDVNVTPVRNPQFVVLKDGSIRNTYEMRLRNKHGEDHWFAFSATTEGGEIFVLTLEGEDSLKVLVPANETRTQRLYVTAPSGSAAATTDRTEFRLWIEDLGSDTKPGTDRVHHDTVFNGKVQ